MVRLRRILGAGLAALVVVMGAFNGGAYANLPGPPPPKPPSPTPAPPTPASDPTVTEQTYVPASVPSASDPSVPVSPPMACSVYANGGGMGSYCVAVSVS